MAKREYNLTSVELAEYLRIVETPSRCSNQSDSLLVSGQVLLEFSLKRKGEQFTK